MPPQGPTTLEQLDLVMRWRAELLTKCSTSFLPVPQPSLLAAYALEPISPAESPVAPLCKVFCSA